jgi:hypothetical protein
MAVKVTCAKQSTGIVTTRGGHWALGSAPVERFETMWQALSAVRSHLELYPQHEAWVGSPLSAHLILPPAGVGFQRWYSQFQQDGTLGSIAAGMTFGEIITQLGWPDDCSAQFSRSPLATILRYGSRHVDFHFDGDGRLCLVHQDDADDPRTILMA